MLFDWKTVTSSRDHAFMVKGTELDMALVPQTRSRLAIYSVRTYDAGRNADVEYIVRDAGKISDADVRQGKRPPIVARFPSLDEFEAALGRAKEQHPTEFGD